TQPWVYVFTEPPAGWSGTIHESARLKLPMNSFLQRLSADGNSVVVNGATSGATVVAAHTAYVFTAPSGGWAGTIPGSATPTPPPGGWHGIWRAQTSAAAKTDSNDQIALALDGNTILAGGQPLPQDPAATDLGVFSLPAPILETQTIPGKPKTSRVRLTGLAA